MNVIPVKFVAENKPQSTTKTLQMWNDMKFSNLIIRFVRNIPETPNQTLEHLPGTMCIADGIPIYGTVESDEEATAIMIKKNQNLLRQCLEENEPAPTK